ncbi:MAG: tyrosine-type recombinase/integrase, partial [Leptospiraceae bacterium]|nr:tyrosine-type recombinase/integrase [Leptospiraceae bacterium]
MELEKRKKDSPASLRLTGEENYDTHVRDFNEYIHTNDLSLNSESIRSFIELKKTEKNRFGKKNSPATLRKIKSSLLQSVKKTFPANSDELAFLEFVFQKIKISKPAERTRPLTKEQVEQIFANCNREYKLLLKFLLVSCVRVSEFCNIRKEDVSPSSNRGLSLVHIREGKGNKERFIEVPSILIKEIQNQIPSEEYLFEYIKTYTDVSKNHTAPYYREKVNRLINDIAEDTFGEDIHLHPHIFRKTGGQI